jgi:tetratricopeptide (TPR) repeat protein
MMKSLAHNKYAVTAFSLLLSLSVAERARADITLPGVPLVDAQEMMDAPEIEIAPDDEGATPQTRLEGWFTELADPDYAGWARAQSDIEREWSKSGSSAMDLLLMRGESALDQGDLAGALEDLTALTDHAPDFAAGWAARGIALFMAGQHGPAMIDFEHALALEPRHFAALSYVGQIYSDMNEEAAAMAAYRASLAINPHQEDVSDELARLIKSREGTAL